MPIRCSCGHEVDSLTECFSAVVKDMVEDGTPAMSLEVLCKPCYENLVAENYLLFNHEEMTAYIKGLIKTKKR